MRKDSTNDLHTAAPGYMHNILIYSIHQRIGRRLLMISVSSLNLETAR